MKLSEFLERLPSGTGLPLRPGAPVAVSQPEAPVAFVAPPLQPSGILPTSWPGIVVVSAPGAVGKSTLAKYIASRTQAAYWDLAKLELGDSTFIGTIASAFGDDELTRVLQGLRNGSTLFVIDALDEAEIRGGWSRVSSFLRQVAERTVGAKAPSVVFCARTDTAARAAAVLQGDDEFGSAVVLEIGFFDEVGAREFVVTQLDDAGHSDAHRRHPTPFAEALGAIFSAVSVALDGGEGAAWEKPSVRGVLGYAPFLQAVAAYLGRYENYTGLADELAVSVAAGSDDAVLASLLDSLLRREQTKFTDQVRHAWPAGLEEPDWNAVFSTRDQLYRCARYVAGDVSAVEPPSYIPPQAAAQLSEAYHLFVPQHPFLRGSSFAGPAFRDYALAACLTDDSQAIYAELQLESGDFVPTPLLANYFARLQQGPGNAEYAAYLYDAAVSRFGLEHAAIATYVSSDDGSGVHSLQVVAEDTAGNEIEALNVPLLISDQRPLTFRRHLRNADIVAEGSVKLRAVDGEFDLAGVDLTAKRLVLDARRLQVQSSRRNSSDTTLRADTCEVVHGVLSVQVQAGATLAVRWENSERHPWSQYHGAETAVETPDRRGVMQALYGLLKWFRKDRRDELAKMADFINNVFVGRHTGRQPLRESLLSYLIDNGIIRLDGRFYRIGDDMVRQHGLNLPALRAAEPHPPLAALIDDFLARYNSQN